MTLRDLFIPENGQIGSKLSNQACIGFIGERKAIKTGGVAVVPKKIDTIGECLTNFC